MQQEATVLCLDASVPLIWEDTIDDARAWKRETITPEDWLVPLPQACLAELDAIAEFVRTYPVPAWYQQPDNLPLDACRQAMADIRERLKHGHGFAILDRVPVERYSVTENKAIGWILASLLAQVVAQKWDGTLLYDVQDSGKPLGHGVRRSVTNLEQDFHTDGGWLWLPPSAIGLFCLQPALHGGLSRVVSLFAVHNTMLRRYPDLLARLYQPFWWDRQAEHAADDRCVNRHPIFR
ncbi:MAG: TauD/TfdA family dioxygenase, partial [Candidatus Tectomicrobia bacterium]|nr:TauD/TfdA family dioxygenase [Candidatus Tectomicrobia bacterium]